MALYLIELTPVTASKDEATALIETVSNSLSEGAELIETQVSADHKLIFAIIESENTAFAPALNAAIGERASVVGPDEVRLVGAELDDIKKLKKDAAVPDSQEGERTQVRRGARGFLPAHLCA